MHRSHDHTHYVRLADLSARGRGAGECDRGRASPETQGAATIAYRNNEPPSSSCQSAIGSVSLVALVMSSKRWTTAAGRRRASARARRCSVYDKAHPEFATPVVAAR
jgi:hypothetical protein